MAINLQALRVFAMVAQVRGFSRAAVRLRISQPAVSKAVATLELQQGLALLERGTRTVRLTEAGTALYERALELFAVERSAEEELLAHRTLASGTLRIGASTTIATYMLPAIMAQFSRRHGSVAMRVYSANTRDIARALLLRKLDVALVEGPLSDPRLEIELWRTEELAIIAEPNHPLANSGKISGPAAISALNFCPFIGRERGSGTRAVTEAALLFQGLNPPVILRLSSTEAVKQSVACGLGIAILSRAAVADQLALGTIAEIAVADFIIKRELSIVRIRGRVSSPSAVLFGDLLRAHRDVSS